MIIPGTKEFEDFARRAKDPNSIEAAIIKQETEKAANQAQGEVRKLLALMIEKVPGQMFRDIAKFHQKFGLAATEDVGHSLPEDVLRFRIKFLQEELQEYVEAVGFSLSNDCVNGNFDVEKAFDALIDLAYVCLGTAYLHRFPFNEGWDRVQEANMAKVRADGANDPRSIRKHSADIVKPEGWKPPVLKDLLDRACGLCNDTGEDIGAMHAGERPKCESCGGTGRIRRVAKAND